MSISESPIPAVSGECADPGVIVISPGNTCDTPLYVHVCSSDEVQVDKEYLCDASTGTWWLTMFADGVQTSHTDTGIPCEDPAPADPEAVSECRSGTLWTVFYAIDPAGVLAPVEVAAFDTGRSCVETIVAPEMVCVSVDGGLSWSQTGVSTTVGLYVVDGSGVMVIAPEGTIVDLSGCECACQDCPPPA